MSDTDMQKNSYDTFYEKVASRVEPNWQARKIIAVVLPTAVELVAIGAFVFGWFKFWPFDMWNMILDSFKIGLPLLAFGIWFSIKLLKGNPTLRAVIVIGIGLSLTAYPAAGIGFKILFNGLLDKSEPSVYRVMVIEKNISEADVTTYYYAQVTSWHGEGSEELKVSGSDFAKIVPKKSSMKITTKPGRFGYEWLLRYEINPPE